MLRVFHHYFSSRKTAFFFAETAAIAVACVAGAFMVAHLFAPGGWGVGLRSLMPLFLMLALTFVLLFQFALYLFDLYDLRIANEDRNRGQRVLRAAGAAAMMAGIAIVALHVRLPTGALLGAALGAFAGTFAVRTALHQVVGDAARVLIVGDGMKALTLARSVEEGGEDSFDVVAMVDPRRLDTVPGSSSATSLDVIAERMKAEYVVTALDGNIEGKWVDDLVRCRFAGIRVYDAAGFSERVLRRMPVAHLRSSELAFSDEMTSSKGRDVLKRAFDIVMASLLALCAAPVMLVVSALIKLDSKGPVFYGQERVGRRGRGYHLWKFRSMRTDAEKNGAVWARTNDDRVTRIGKFIRKTRMDEVPQVFNVLLGDMSFVGPRPERPVFVEQLRRQIPFYGLREGVKPGITGWAQIRYPYGASVDDARNKLEFDLYYVKNRSLALDLAIIFHTVRHVLLGKGAR